MQFLPKPGRSGTWLAFAGLGLALLLGSGFLFLRAPIKLSSLNPKPTAIPVDESSKPRRLDATEQKYSLLTDSILSIVQSYYVDSSRVDNSKLLEMALKSLDANPAIKAGVAEGKAWLQMRGRRKEFQVTKPLKYEKLLRIYRDAALMIDESGVVISPVDARDRERTGAVAVLNSMLTSLDAHSALLSVEAYRELRQGTEGSFGGLGVLVGIRDNLLTVIKPLPKSPAMRAGIMKQDRILGIDDVYTYGYSLDELVEYMRGDPGTSVRLVLLREGAVAPRDFTLRREVITVDSVTSSTIADGAMMALHLAIENFSSRTSQEVLDAIKTARKANSGQLHGLVLDLRSNPGGLLDQAVQVADLFLKSGVIVTTKGRREEIETAGKGYDVVDFPVVVLINGDSASASEIVAGALQDHYRAVVIGQPSFGKGSVQTIFELPGERALKLTIARYYTPSGATIQNMGIMPDIWLQPLVESNEHTNLLGMYRYKNERFLRNHLASSRSGMTKDEDHLRSPVIKGYYLTPQVSQLEDANGPDRELEIALQIVRKVHKTYGNRLPVGSRRATHWLNLAAPEIKKTMANLDRKVGDWLGSREKVDWRSVKGDMPPDLHLTIDRSTRKIVKPGEVLSIGWTIENRSFEDVGRLSVFARSEIPGFETQEVLVGRIAAKATKRGKVAIPIPTYWESGPMNLRVGVAAEAWPANMAAKTHSIMIVPRNVARISAEVELVENPSSHVVGRLEANEHARLKVKLRNEGEVDARDVKLAFINLSGDQVTVDLQQKTIKRIRVGETRLMMFDMNGNQRLVSSDISLGLSVECGDLQVPLRQRVAIDSKPSVLGVGTDPMSH